MSGANSIDLELVTGAPEELLAGEISSMYEQWKSAAIAAHDRWKETTQYVYATSTKETTNDKNGHSHSTHIPVITQIKDNLEANYFEAAFPNDDWFMFKGYDMTSTYASKRKVVESYLKTKHDIDRFTVTAQRLISDWVLYGNCFAGVTYVRETNNAAEMLGTGYVGPRVYRISPFDIVFNPMATSFEDSPKVIRSVKTMGELMRDAQDNPELNYSSEVVQRVIDTRTNLGEYSDADIDKAFNMDFEGFGSAAQYYKAGKVEILEFYGDIWDSSTNSFLKNHVITVVDRRWVLRSQPLDTWSGRPHIFHCGWRTRPDNIWAMGPLDNLIGMQYLINHLENSRADAFDAMINPDRVFRGPVEDIQKYNGAIHYYVPENGNVQNISPDATVLNADFQIQNKQQQMELVAGAPREAAGFRTPGEKTAFEVGQLMNAASRLFQHKINMFSRDFLEKIVEAEIEVARKYLDTVDIVEIIQDETGISEFLEITREDIMANGRLVAIGSRHYARNNQLAANLAQFSQQLAQDPLLQQHFPSEKLARAYEQLLGFSALDLVEPYGRVGEQTNLQSLTNAAAGQLQEEAITPIDEGEYAELAASETMQ